MNAITSIYIPRIENVFNAEFIADVFNRNGIAQVSRVYIEPYKSIMTNGLKYNRAYIGIKTWHDTEAAFNFIERLRNPTREARIFYGDDNWWQVDVNKYPHKLTSNKHVLTIFEEKEPEFYDDFSTAAVAEESIDYEKTKMLKKIIANFTEKKISFPKPSPVYRMNSIDCECNRELKARIYGYKDADEMDAAEAFGGYLHEMADELEKWFSEQYIFDSIDL